MKQHYIYTFALIILFSSCDIRKNNNTTEKKSAPTSTENKIDVPPTSAQIIDSVYDFKKIKEGDIVEYNYRFKNTGDKPLVVSEALASCGCTVPEKPEHPIAPGEIGFIKVKFNSDHRPGETHKTITITSNARPEFPVLLLKGTVIGKTE
jgi:hypothetical protein